jgi:hypothetical protein
MKKIRETLKKIFGGWDFNDLFALSGAGLVGWGVWRIYAPAALILIGAGLVWWGLMGSRIKPRSKK